MVFLPFSKWHSLTLFINSQSFWNTNGLWVTVDRAKWPSSHVVAFTSTHYFTEKGLLSPHVSFAAFIKYDLWIIPSSECTGILLTSDNTLGQGMVTVRACKTAGTVSSCLFLSNKMEVDAVFWNIFICVYWFCGVTINPIA